MEVGVILETGLSARLNVVEESKPGPENVTTLLPNTVVQTVREMTLKLKNVTHAIAQAMIVKTLTRDRTAAMGLAL